MAKSSAKNVPEIKPERRAITYLRLSALTALTTLGCLAVIAFTVTHWLENHILNTDAWVATVAPLPQEPVVNAALSSYITGQVYSNVNVEQRIQNALPPKASFLAAPLASQLHTLLTQVAKRALASNGFQTVWVSANRLAMSNLVMNARSPNPGQNGKLNQLFNVNLSGVKATLASRLGTTANAIPALQPQSQKSLTIGANLKTKRERLWQYVRTADFLNIVLPFVVAASFLGTLAFSRDRRKTLLIVSLIVIILLLLEQIGLKAARQNILDQVKNTDYRSAVGYIYDTLTAPLRSYIYSLLVPAVLIVVGCFIASPADWAVRLRQRITNFSFIQTAFRYWHIGRRSVRQYQYAVWGGIGMLLLIWLAFIGNITVRAVAKDLLVTVALLEIVYIVAHPRPLTRM